MKTWMRSHCPRRLLVHKPAALCHIIPRMAWKKGFHKHSAEGMGLFPEAVKKSKICQRACRSRRWLCNRVLNNISQTSSEVFQQLKRLQTPCTPSCSSFTPKSRQAPLSRQFMRQTEMTTLFRAHPGHCSPLYNDSVIY